MPRVKSTPGTIPGKKKITVYLSNWVARKLKSTHPKDQSAHTEAALIAHNSWQKPAVGRRPSRNA